MNKVKQRGVVFTPEHIVKYMLSFIDDSKHPKRILEPSCGDGSIIKLLNKKHDILGIDIDCTFIEYCKKNFLHAKFKCQDFLEFSTNIKYDYIIGNPPYVSVQNMSKASVSKMQNDYPDIIYGNTNLYAYFILKCCDLLKDDGLMVFICPNTFLYNKSLGKLKKFLFHERRIRVLIDFKDKQIFPNVLTYTCIIVVSRKPNTCYMYGNDISKRLKKIEYKEYIPHKIDKKESNVYFRIGIMTLCDHVFVIKNYVLKQGYIHFEKEGKKYKIEEESCQNILKVSKKQIHRIIYPYLVKDEKVVIDYMFLQKYPKCAKYLNDYKNMLKMRDNGKTELYPTWYAYGRTQALLPYKKPRLFIPSTVKDIKNNIFISKTPLYYSGLWIKSDGIGINKLCASIKKNEQTILSNSNNKSDGWYALTYGSFANIVIK